jgi:CHAD domain-containing protein
MKTAPQNSMAKFAEAEAARRLKVFQVQFRRVAANPEKAKPIHDLRVSIRRLIRVLRIFRLLWDRGHYRKMRRRLRELMDLCGAVRNCDIAVQVLEEAVKQAPPPADAAPKVKRQYLRAVRRCAYLRVTYLPKRRKRAEDNLVTLVESWKEQGTLEGWAGRLTADAGNDQDLAAFAQHALRPMAEEYFEAGDRAARKQTSFEQMHRFRLMAKRFRYSLEIFGPLAGTEWEQGIAEIRAMQDLLGAVNDCVSTRAIIAGTGRDGSNVLVKQLTGARDEVFRAAWAHNKKSRSWWMGWLARPRRGH